MSRPFSYEKEKLFDSLKDLLENVPESLSPEGVEALKELDLINVEEGPNLERAKGSLAKLSGND